MKPICHLNVNIPVLKSNFIFPKIENIENGMWKYFKKIPIENILTEDILEFFLKNNLSPHPECLLFYAPVGSSLNLHSDGGGPEAFAINWALTSVQPEMIWYNAKAEGIAKVAYADSTPTHFTSYEEKDLEEIYRDKIQSPSIVKIGIPHGGFNDSIEGAWLVSVRFKTRLTFDQVCEQLSQYQLDL